MIEIKDKDGNALKFGDHCRDMKEHKPFGFCYSGFNKSLQRPGPYGVFVDHAGQKTTFPALPDGSIPVIERIIEYKNLHEDILADWIESTDYETKINHIVCNRCGSPLPIKSDVDDIDISDNLYCYWCGSRMGRI